MRPVRCTSFCPDFGGRSVYENKVKSPSLQRPKTGAPVTSESFKARATRPIIFIAWPLSSEPWSLALPSLLGKRSRQHLLLSAASEADHLKPIRDLVEAAYFDGDAGGYRPRQPARKHRQLSTPVEVPAVSPRSLLREWKQRKPTMQCGLRS